MNRLSFYKASKTKGSSWYLCSCGKKKKCCDAKVRCGHTKSCGCLRTETLRNCAILRNKTSPPAKTHGRSSTPEYRAWLKMRERCNRKCNDNYGWYGGRGIKVCKRWENSFENFYADMGDKPGPAFSLDRICNSRGYTPSNCRWATKKQQAENRRTSCMVHHKGKTMCLSQWASQAGLNVTTFRDRLRAGWGMEKALLPVKKKGPTL